MANSLPALTPEERRFIQMSGLTLAAEAVAGIFLSLFMFQASGFGPVAKYWAAGLATLTFGMIAGGYLLARFDTRAMIRSSFLMSASLYCLVLFLGDRTAELSMLLGAMNGVALSAYWSAFNVTELAVTHEERRPIYMGVRLLWDNACPTVAQLASGVVVAAVGAWVGTRYGYLGVFGLLVVAYLFAFVHARGIATCRGVRFRLRDCLNKPPSPAWRHVLAMQFFRGLNDRILVTLPPILIFVVADRELTVTTFTASVTLLAGLSGVIAGRFLHRHPRGFVVGAIGLPTGMLIMALFPGWIGLVGYVLAVGLIVPYSTIPASAAIYNSMERSGLDWKRNYHYFIENEVVLNLGRIISFLLILAVIPDSGDQTEAVRTLLIGFAAAPLVIGYLQHKIHVRLRRPAVDVAGTPSLV